VSAVVFDYGSTLVEFAPAELARCDEAMSAEIARRFGPHDTETFRRLRAADRARPFSGEPPSYRETPLDELSGGLVSALYGVNPSPEDVHAISAARRHAFVGVVRKPAYLDALLSRLRERFRLGVLSNYPDGVTIRDSFTRIQLEEHFEFVHVSGDLGVVKPHPDAFAAVRDSLGVPAEEILYVGDNWLADVQGAKRAGMRAVLSTQFLTPEPPPRHAGDHEPDATIGHLLELSALLM